MRGFSKTIIFVVLMLFAIGISYASDWYGSFTVRGGRTDPECDIESEWKTFWMFGASYEFWYKDIVSIGPYVYFSRLQGGPLSPSISGGTWSYPDNSNFKSYIAGADVKARFRPNWKWINLRFPDKFINRVAPYVDGGAGIITFDPKDRFSTDLPGLEVLDDGTQVPKDYDYHCGVFPVYGGGITLFSKLGVNMDIGVEYHQPNTDFLDGVKDNDDKDSFWTGYLGLMLISSYRPAGLVVIPAEPVIIPEAEAEIKFVPQLQAIPTTQTVPAQSGIALVDIKSNLNWVAAENEDWFDVTPLSGSRDGQLTVTYKANASDISRTGKIIISGGGLSRIVTITQSSSRLAVTPAIRDVTWEGGATAFDIDSNLSWSVSENVNWLTVTPLSGVNSGQLVVNFEPNAENQSRVGQLTVSGGGIVRTVSVVQSGRTIEFTREKPLILEGVNFKVDRADLTESAKKILDEVVRSLKENPEVKLDIQGHTDSDGTDAYNMDLSKRRALTVKQYLVDHGIDGSRLTVSWFGESKPIASNDTPEGKAKNRRIEFVRTDK